MLLDKRLLKNGILTDDTPLFRRYLTMHERWFLMRRNTGYQFTITVLVTYPNAAAAPAEKKLRGRIMELQDHFPQLNCRLRDTRTRRPYWEERPTHRGSANFYARRTHQTASDEDIIGQEQARMEAEDFDEGDRPLWQVTLYDSADPGAKAYLAVSALHECIDGRGMLRLVHALLADDIVDLPHESLALPTYPDTIDIRPSWSFLLPFAIQQLVVPYLPTYVTSYFTPRPVWPAHVTINPLTLPGRTFLATIPGDLVDLLKSLGKYQGVPTLTPVLLAAWLAAMRIILHRGQGVSLSASVAMDERKQELGHSYCTGLYHASNLYSVDLDDTVSFWQTARNLALHLAHPSSLNTARMRMGMTAYVPDGPVPLARRDDSRRPTGWEDWQLQQNEQLRPYMSSVSFSNLGKIDLPAGATGLVVTSSASIGDPPIKLVLTGSMGGIEAAGTFRNGDILSDEGVREMMRAWIGFLRVLVDGRGEDLSLGQLQSRQ